MKFSGWSLSLTIDQMVVSAVPFTPALPFPLWPKVGCSGLQIGRLLPGWRIFMCCSFSTCEQFLDVKELYDSLLQHWCLHQSMKCLLTVQNKLAKHRRDVKPAGFIYRYTLGCQKGLLAPPIWESVWQACSSHCNLDENLDVKRNGEMVTLSMMITFTKYPLPLKMSFFW